MVISIGTLQALRCKNVFKIVEYLKVNIVEWDKPIQFNAELSNIDCLRKPSLKPRISSLHYYL